MSFIDSSTFEVYSEVTTPKVEQRSFECDDLIAPIISLLNKKGYKTKFCCAGHPYSHYTEMYLLVYDGEKGGISSILGTIEDLDSKYITCIREVSKEEIPEEHQFLDEEINELKPHKFYYAETTGLVYGNVAYISFEKDYFSEDNLPLGWELYEEECFDKDERNRHCGFIMQYEFVTHQDIYYFYTQQIAVFMDLYNWVKALPIIDEE